MCSSLDQFRSTLTIIEETTAHSFAATLAHLAADQDVQQEVLDQIISVVGWDREPVGGLASCF